MSDLLSLSGRTALITGAGQGVGRQIALHMAHHDAKAVVICDFYRERAEAVADEVRQAGSEALAVTGDVSDFSTVADFHRQVAERFGGVDIMVNNAGNAGPTPTDAMTRPFWEQSPTEWHGYLGTNLYGVMNNVHAALPGMIQRRYGRIVTVISDAGRFGEPGRESYSAAKAGAAGFTRSVAATVGRHTITANCISLGATRTPRTEAGLSDDERLKKMMKKYIIRRPGEPTDAANLVLFLASDAAPWITGQTIPVNGGYSFAL